MNNATHNGVPAFEFEYIPIDVIVKLIKEINIHKSSATPRLSTRLLKAAYEVLSGEIAHMLNLSLSTGEFPDSWCVGLITPLPTTGNLLDANNWRPDTIDRQAIGEICSFTVAVILV